MDRKKNLFDKIGSLIPGYRGYSERESRRNCDKTLREGIVAKLIEAEKILYEKMNDALKQKNKELIKDTEEARKQLNTFISKIKYSPHGTSGFFSDNQIKEDELFSIYEIDLDLANSVNTLYERMYTKSLFEIKELLQTSQTILTKRNIYINEFKG